MLVAGAREGEQLPMLVAFHWYGARPDALRAWLRGIAVPARVILPYGPYPQGQGFAWWPEARAREQGAAAVINAATDDAARTIAALVRRFPTSGRPIVTGLSHGGDIAFALAARHPDAIGASVPIAARLPEGAWPAAGHGPLPRIDLFQGAIDAIVPVEETIATVAGLRARGVPIMLHYVPGVGHDFPAAMQADVRDRIEARLRAGLGPVSARATPP